MVYDIDSMSASHSSAVLVIIFCFEYIFIMQILIQTRKVEDEKRKQVILEMLADQYSQDILQIIMNKPKSVMDITAETRIPVSTVYRRIQLLHDNKIVSISGTISDDGKKYFLYKSKIRSVSITSDCYFTKIEIVPNIVHSEEGFLEDNMATQI